MPAKFSPYSVPKPTPQEVQMKRIISELQQDILSHVILDCVVDGDTQFAHKLARQPAGWIVIDLQDANVVTRVSWDSSYITLTSSASTRCRIYVF